MVLKEMYRSIGELLRFFWMRKRWWLMPMIVLLLCIAFLIALGSATGVGPIIYTLF